jgi:hypothetical protein
MSNGARTVDFKIPILFLCPLRDIYMCCLISDTEFFERDGDFLAVGRAGCV